MAEAQQMDAYLREHLYFRDEFSEADLQHRLDLEGFDGLWQATEATLPFFQSYKSDSDKIISELNEQLRFQVDELAGLKQENYELKQEIAEIIKVAESLNSIKEDYSNLVSLNRTLTKQLNSLMLQREKEKQQLQALKDFLN